MEDFEVLWFGEGRDVDNNDSLYSATYVSNSGPYVKEQKDVALASTLLRMGLLTERQLSGVLSNWTLHGNLSLAEHILDEEVLDGDVLKRAEVEAERRLATVAGDLTASQTGNSRTGSVVIRTLEVLDTSGTISKLLGIHASAGVAAEEGRELRETVGRYKLLRKLGQGGLGRVWLGYDEILRRHVALKEIAQSADPQALERFRREAEITGRLEHPGIVPVYGLGEDLETGDFFYAMRFLGKQTLHDAILEYHERRSDGTDHPLIVRQLLTAFVSVCQAIGHAHSRKVVHRDLKPENVAIDSFGQVIVIDWGLAKVLDETNGGDLIVECNDFDAEVSAPNTIEGQVMGTPLYMSPEQAGGRLDELNEKTDIYGLGAILFAILTGAPPHELTRSHASLAGGTQRDLLTAIAADPTPSVRALNPDIDPALAAICEKALARRQYARYDTAMQLSEDVQRWMAGESVTALKETLPQELWRWIQKHRLLSQVIGGLLTMMVVSLVALGISSRLNMQAKRDFLFQGMIGKEQELTRGIQAVIWRVAKDTRFMASVPPIESILKGKTGAAAGLGFEESRMQLCQIFEGLLRANENYLSISYFQVGENPAGLGTVERQLSGSPYVRTLSASLLKPFNDTIALEKISKLYPGEIWIDLDDRLVSSGVVQLRSYLPVHDETTGVLFGFLRVVTDLTKEIEKVVSGIELQRGRILVTDAAGKIWSETTNATTHSTLAGTNISETFPALDSFFSVKDRPRYLDEDEGLIASRLDLIRHNSNLGIGLVLLLDD
ncbi:serine/threonine-protein kinase [Planctomicrobium sp. SH668]|uniref:serine/threonine-protein kinase n=1 Tax=Planctomicrobium sp. SH668 TaxID=3448126 RepID=UPI003F5B67D0